MSRKADYDSHLRSDRWRSIRKEASDRSLGLCELCKCAAAETHHIAYPKNFSNDTASNVLHVCSACHRKLHGMTRLVTDLALTEVSVLTFKDRPMSVHVDHRRWAWAPWTDWIKALVVPASLVPNLSMSLQMHADRLSKEDGEPYYLPHPKGSMYFRWAAIDENLLRWYIRLEKGKARQEWTDDERFLVQNLAAIRRWGRQLQEKYIADAISKGAPAAADSSVLQRAVALQVELAERSEQHEARIGTIEKQLHRDPQEFVDTHSFVIEVGRSPAINVAGTDQTPQQWLGSYLSRKKAETGAKVQLRLDGCGVKTLVNTYRRRDLQAAYEQMPKF